jgi:hypothetical protein
MEINNFLKPSQAQQEVSNRLKPGPKDKSGFLRVEGRISRETSDLIEKMISESPYFTTR